MTKLQDEIRIAEILNRAKEKINPGFYLDLTLPKNKKNNLRTERRIQKQ